MQAAQYSITIKYIQRINSLVGAVKAPFLFRLLLERGWGDC
ncbi:MAG: hypothetical protein RLZZ367_1298 [Bacteroidota bacterium]|jgi:hypothetical protein